ncbi:MAG: CcmD family protein [Anaerolineae bacterium]
MVYLTGAYLIIWAASFAFILSVARRQARLEAELKALQELSREKGASR